MKVSIFVTLHVGHIVSYRICSQFSIIRTVILFRFKVEGTIKFFVIYAVLCMLDVVRIFGIDCIRRDVYSDYTVLYAS